MNESFHLLSVEPLKLSSFLDSSALLEPVASVKKTRFPPGVVSSPSAPHAALYGSPLKLSSAVLPEYEISYSPFTHRPDWQGNRLSTEGKYSSHADVSNPLAGPRQPRSLSTSPVRFHSPKKSPVKNTYAIPLTHSDRILQNPSSVSVPNSILRAENGPDQNTNKFATATTAEISSDEPRSIGTIAQKNSKKSRAKPFLGGVSASRSHNAIAKANYWSACMGQK